jgi:hypothetical protein
MGSLHDEYKEMMRRRDLWTDEMRWTTARSRSLTWTMSSVASSKTVCATCSTLRMANSTRQT